MKLGSPRLLGLRSSWSRLTLAGCYAVLLLAVLYGVFSSRYQLYIPKLAVQCLSWNFGVVDKWQKDVELGKPYAFYSRGMGIYDDGEKIAKIFAAGAFDTVEIDADENVRVNGEVKAHGLQMAAKLGHKREDFMGKALLEPGEFFGLGTTYTSFDSRYWGTIHESQIIGRLYFLL